jgi:hypothetical protein
LERGNQNMRTREEIIAPHHIRNSVHSDQEKILNKILDVMGEVCVLGLGQITCGDRAGVGRRKEVKGRKAGVPSMRGRWSTRTCGRRSGTTSTAKPSSPPFSRPSSCSSSSVCTDPLSTGRIPPARFR